MQGFVAQNTSTYRYVEVRFEAHNSDEVIGVRTPIPPTFRHGPVIIRCPDQPACSPNNRKSNLIWVHHQELIRRRRVWSTLQTSSDMFVTTRAVTRGIGSWNKYPYMR